MTSLRAFVARVSGRLVPFSPRTTSGLMLALASLSVSVPNAGTAQVPAPAATPAPAPAPAAVARDTIITAPILAPRKPLPSEAATAKVRKFSFIAYGDTRGRFDGTALQVEHGMVVASMLATIKRLAATSDPIRFIVQGGDPVVNGSLARQLNVSYIPLVNRLTQEGQVPYLPAVGNHDVGTSTDLANTRRLDGLHNYFASTVNLIPAAGSKRRLKGYPTYAFGYGNTFFVTFDSDIPDDSVQFAWVKAQLEGLDRKRFVNVVMSFHHPAFSSGAHGGLRVEPQAASIRSRWLPLFRRHHVRLLLNGHEHFYEHWVERYRDASGAHRMDHIVTGGGGAPLYKFVGAPDLTEYLRANAAAKVSMEHLVRPGADSTGNPYHFVIVHVDGERFSLEVIGVDWGRDFAPYRSNAVSLQDQRP